MFRQRILVASMLLLALETSLSAADPPEAVRAWLKANVGKWEIVGGVQPGEVAKHVSELTAGGTVLLTRGTTGDGVPFVSTDAWEADKEKLVTTIYLANGAYLRREQDVEKRAISGTVEALDGDGKPFSGRLTAKLTGRGVIESVYEGSLAGKQVVLKWKATRMPTEGGQPADMPEKAREALGYFVGQWEADTYENGEKIGQCTIRWRWSRGKYCLAVDWAGVQNGAESLGTAVSGWDANAKAVVEHWYYNEGLSVSVCYPLERMKPEVWEGTASVTTPDGRNVATQCRLTKTQGGYEYTSRAEIDGKKMEYKVVARRMKK